MVQLAVTRRSVRRARGNNGRRRAVVLTNADRERIAAQPDAEAVFDAVATRRDEFGENVSALRTMLDEPLWSRFTIPADGVTATPQTVRFFALATGQGINQSRFINNSQLEGSMSFKIQAIALAIQSRSGQANFDTLQFSGAVFGQVGTSTQFNYPLEAGMIQESSIQEFAADGAAAATTIQGMQGVNKMGLILRNGLDLRWPPNVGMTWELRFAAAPTFATPPDGVDDFIVSLILYGYKSQQAFS